VQAAEGVAPAASSGFDPHKRINGRKRHLLTDTLNDESASQVASDFAKTISDLTTPASSSSTPPSSSTTTPPPTTSKAS
jgi:hypothetical protein